MSPRPPLPPIASREKMQECLELAIRRHALREISTELFAKTIMACIEREVLVAKGEIMDLLGRIHGPPP